MHDSDTSRSLHWFALAVKPRFEEAVARTLGQKGYESFLPLYRNEHQNGKRSQEHELPLFPGYVCCRFDLRYRPAILATPGVVQIVGDGNVPIALADNEIASLQASFRAQLPLRPFPFVQAGQRVRIEDGELAGVEGIAISFHQTLRLVLSITVLQKSALLEIGRDRATVSGFAGGLGGE
jgi:transcription antitermination factor NusG